MPLIHASYGQTIGAPADKIYGLLRDYHEGHPAILPDDYFASLTVESGGQGAGTALSVVMTRLGGGQSLNMVVSEPEPGRMLVEEDSAAGIKTTFTVDALSPESAHVAVESAVERGTGVAAFLQSLVAPAMMRRMFKKQLELLEERMRQS